jgi:hypothetical protein
MKKKIALFLFLVCFLSVSALFGQTYSRGAILDNEQYNKIPQKAVQLTRSYTALPKAFSLKKYAPMPGDQNPWGTCVGWSSAYAARTISESIAMNRTNTTTTTSNAFSALYVYKGSYETLFHIIPTGHEGACISDILGFMKNIGAVKRPDFEKTLDFPAITYAMYAKSQRYPIGGFVTLYAYNENIENKIRTERVKKSLSEGKPVIIGMVCPPSFSLAKDVWKPIESPTGEYSGHAMCVVGYDDTKYGGAFEIQNSWGTKWGNGGYIWITYDVFNQFAYHAYEIIEHLATFKDGAEYDGFVNIEVHNTHQGMPVWFDNGYYKTTGSYQSGTRFRYLIGNKKPAYVYAFAGDSATTETTRIFPPPDKNFSPVLDYSENTVALPGETLWIELDQVTGTDFLVVLYSKEELDIDAIRNRFSKAKGNFPERVASAVGSNYMPAHQSTFDPNKMQFTAKSGSPKAVFGLLLAIEHN